MKAPPGAGRPQCLSGPKGGIKPGVCKRLEGVYPAYAVPRRFFRQLWMHQMALSDHDAQNAVEAV